MSLWILWYTSPHQLYTWGGYDIEKGNIIYEGTGKIWNDKTIARRTYHQTPCCCQDRLHTKTCEQTPEKISTGRQGCFPPWEHHNIRISPSCLRNILAKQFILSPKATRRTKKQMNARLRHMHRNTSCKKEKIPYTSGLVIPKPISMLPLMIPQEGLSALTSTHRKPYVDTTMSYIRF